MIKTNILEAVTERDIDLLLLEEIHASPQFRDWLISTTCDQLQKPIIFVNAWHSLSDPALGESDLVFVFCDALDRKLALLIENKIDAPPQPDQAKRYTARGRKGIEQGDWESFKSLLVAPLRYLTGSADAPIYDHRVSYEEIRKWFLMQSEHASRGSYKAKLVDLAIEQNKRGYTPQVDERVTRFFHDYWKCASQEFPELEMEEPVSKSAGSNWVGFHPKALVKCRWIWHKMDVGHVDLEIKNAAATLDHLRSMHAHLFPPDTEFVKAGKSAAVRIRVAILDRFADFHEQIESARAGMRAAYRLLYQSRVIRDA